MNINLFSYHDKSVAAFDVELKDGHLYHGGRFANYKFYKTGNVFFIYFIL